MVESAQAYEFSPHELSLIEQYREHEFDKKPRITDLTQPLSVSLFVKEPTDVLNQPLSDVIGSTFLAKRGTAERERELSTQTDQVGCEYFEGCRYIGLVFSADWCAPCHTMLDLLRNFYTDINLDERQFEVLLISADKTEKDWHKHYMTMPWASLPFTDHRTQILASKYDVQGVPQLVIIDAKTGITVTKTARKDIAKATDTAGVMAIWRQWAKLLEINRVRAVKAATSTMRAEAEMQLRVEVERRKNEIERIQSEGGTIGQTA